jgi:hypothetical protein
MKVPTQEKSLFIPNISQKHIQALGKKYQQDSVLFADDETRAKGEATFIDSKSGEAFNIGKFSPGKIAQGYSKIKGGKVFTFEPKSDEEPKKDDTAKKDDIKLKSLVPKDILDKTVKNPKTGRNIKVKTALKYDKSSPAYGAATTLVKQAKKSI